MKAWEIPAVDSQQICQPSQEGANRQRRRGAPRHQLQRPAGSGVPPRRAAPAGAEQVIQDQVRQVTQQDPAAQQPRTAVADTSGLRDATPAAIPAAAWVMPWGTGRRPLRRRPPRPWRRSGPVPGAPLVPGRLEMPASSGFDLPAHSLGAGTDVALEAGLPAVGTAPVDLWSANDLDALALNLLGGP